nr:putative integron gene cassette protein [uncultured bacterium]
MRFLSKVIGYLISSLGLGVVIFGLLALADPHGSQHANDSDPFGLPPSNAQILVLISFGVLGLILGF